MPESSAKKKTTKQTNRSSTAARSRAAASAGTGKRKKSKGAAGGSQRTSPSKRTQNTKNASKGTGRPKASGHLAESAAGREASLEKGTLGAFQDEIFLMASLVASVLVLLSFFNLCGVVGVGINFALFGSLGLGAYLFPFLLFFGVAFALSNQGFLPAKIKLYSGVGLYAALMALMQLAIYGYDKEQKLTDCFIESANAKSGGGFIGGAISKGLCYLFGEIGACAVLIGLILILLMLITEKLLFAGLRNQSIRRKTSASGKMPAPRKRAAAGRQKEETEIPIIGDEEEEAEEAAAHYQVPTMRSRLRKEREEASKFAAVKSMGDLSILKGYDREGRQEAAVPIHAVSMGEAAGAASELSFYEKELEEKFNRQEEEALLNLPIIKMQEEFSNTAVEEMEFPMPENIPICEDEEPELKHGFLNHEEEVFVSAGAQRETSKESRMPRQNDSVMENGVELEEKAVPAAENGVELEKKAAPAAENWMELKEKAAPAAENRMKLKESAVPAAENRVELKENVALGAGNQERFRESAALGAEDQGNPAGEPGVFKEKESFAADEQSGVEANAANQVTPSPVSPALPKDVRETRKEQQTVQEDLAKAKEAPPKKYILPSLHLLSRPDRGGMGDSDELLRKTAKKLKDTLDSFGVKVEMKNISCGPTVTRFELQPAQGVKVSRITNLTDDIKLSLAAADIRIEAPIPGKAAVGIEVPNREKSIVRLRSLLESREFKGHASKLAFAVGKDIGGNTVVADIAKMPHLLIAGATGSGKSVCINTLIMSILYKADPADVKLIMVDPKVVELSVYNGIPHLLIPVVTDPKKASGALHWAVAEMTDRYQKFAELGVRDVKGYNKKISAAGQNDDPRFQKMPQIVIIVDELADLMMVAPGEVEDAICRLAQLARAAGIHLVIATQRPSVNVITGLIKANIPSRIAFSVSSAVDSRTILDGGGAEKLLGNGDMLFFPSGYPKPVRVQGSFVSDKEVSDVVAYLTEQNGGSVSYDETVTNQIAQASSASGGLQKGADRDDYFMDAGRFVIEKDKASIGMLQRVFKIGFNRAARIMDQLCDAGVVGEEEGTKPRKVLMSLEQFDAYIEENG